MTTQADIEAVARRVLWVKQTVARNPYIPHDPTPRQTAALALQDCEEVGYGGAAGAGKSDYLLMESLLYVDRPEYSGLLIRKTHAELTLPGALLDRAHSWIAGRAHWNGESSTFRFHTGATLTFGYLGAQVDRQRYQSAEFDSIGVDEATTLRESDYLFMFSRLRRQAGSDIPSRMRSGTNPPTLEVPGSDWYERRFSPECPRADRPFVKATLWDNPHIDQAAYIRNLDRLDPVTCQRLKYGVWGLRAAGKMFRREWFPVVERLPRMLKRQVRWWDTAATEEPAVGETGDPDFTVGMLLCQDHRDHCYIVDVVRGRWDAGKVEDVMVNQALIDGKEVSIRWGEEPGSAGRIYSAGLRRRLRGYDTEGVPESGKKEVRARLVSAAAKHGEISVVSAPWYGALMQELEAFPSKGVHDDTVDCLSGAYSKLSFRADVADLERINAELAQPTGLLTRRPV